MKRKIFLLLLTLSFALSSYAQQPNLLDGAYIKEHTRNGRKPLAYPFLREADVMWSKKIWRVIELKEKINLPLSYPLSGSIVDRKSLIDVLMDGLKEGTLTAYGDDEWIMPTTYTEIEVIGGARMDTQKLQRPEPPYDEYDTIIKRDFKRDDVIAYRVKEEWYFDKQRSVMDVRVIGICPMVYARDELGNIREGNMRKQLCWFYYDECRNLLSQSETFNRQNDAERRSFDDIFQKRMFNSYIYKEANVYDRRIEDYRTTGIAQMLESDKIKQEIVNLEHDMWEY